MDTTEQVAIEKIGDAFRLLPDNKREYLLGYAEGAVAMSGISKEEKPDTTVEKEPA